jgi:hypothetical protein
MLYIVMLWITDLTSCTLPAIDNKGAFQEESFNSILSAIDCKWKTLGFPLKICTPRKLKGKVPILKLRSWTMIDNLPWVIEPE